VYTDLDGTLLGRGGSLFRDADGGFSRAQSLALEACHRAEVEVVVKSGRREAQVRELTRLMGQTSYIYEAGCALVTDGEQTVLTGEWTLDDDGTPAEKMLAAGAPDLLFERFPNRLEWHRPWHTDRRFSHLFRGAVDVVEANAHLRQEGHEGLRFLDNGATGQKIDGQVAHAYHLVPGEASKARAVAFHMRVRGYAPEECIGVGDSIEDLGVSESVGRFFVVANGPERDPGLREAIGDRSNVTVTEGRMGDGFYEAVLETLATG
jgi:hypothetical protein